MTFWTNHAWTIEENSLSNTGSRHIAHSTGEGRDFNPNPAQMSSQKADQQM